MRKRLLVGLMLLAIVPGQALASSAPSRGLSKAYWDSLSPAQQNLLVKRLSTQMLADVAAGRATVHSAEKRVSLTPGAAGAGVSAISVSGWCRVEWVTTPGTGDWVRATAWTESSAVISRIETRTNLFEDGVFRKGAFVSTPNDDYASATTSYVFTAWWDTSQWRVRSEHTAINNGVFLWNKVPCTWATTF